MLDIEFHILEHCRADAHTLGHEDQTPPFIISQLPNMAQQALQASEAEGCPWAIVSHELAPLPGLLGPTEECSPSGFCWTPAGAAVNKCSSSLLICVPLNLCTSTVGQGISGSQAEEASLHSLSR